MNHGCTGGTSAESRLTIVALGASAGGLEALQGFFGALTPDPRLAFVVVTHLAPQHASNMAGLLSRGSDLPVTEARDGERVKAGQVYVIPPDRLMSIHDGALRLEQPSPRPAILRTIDHFMCALADDQQECSAGIVLSGADHDGTVGLKEIKAAGGLTLAQDPKTARFPSMPRSAIAAGIPDRVLPVERMGQALLDYLACAPPGLALDEPAPVRTPAAVREEADAGMQAGLREILALVQAQSGQDFRWYRPSMLFRRVRRRMGLNRLAEVSAYLDLLRDSTEELNALVKDFLISITEFFREPEAWQVLEEEVIPELVHDRVAGAAGVRVWTPGCATGEESYSIAMILLEQLGAQQGGGSLNVFASDVDTDALGVARAGVYPEAICATVPPARLARFFEKRGERYAVRKALREAVVFAPQNLVRDPPFSRLDLIVCRNLLIYFEPAQQSRVLELFHFALNPGGVLFLGKSESLGAQADLYEPISREHRIFRRVGATTHPPLGFPGKWSGPGGFHSPTARQSGDAARGPAELALEQLGERAVAAAVLINRDGRALYFHGDTGRYLQPVGEPTWDLLTLAREGLRVRLRSAVRRAITTGRPATLEAGVTRDAHFTPVNVRVELLADFARSGLLLVSFDEPASAGSMPGKQSSALDEPAALRELEEELRNTRSELLAAVQEGENANAELRVANEEAMSMNEELQASNEELESSKEELQSLNEELSTVNSQLEGKLVELEQALNDLRNLMDNTRVATLFLDRELRIRRFTRPASWLFHVLPSDEGRPLRDITSRVVDPDLLEQARGVLESHEPVEAEVGTANGEWFLRRILPFRTKEETVEGVVVTYIDITALRRAAQDAARLAAVLHDSHDAVIVHDFDGRILSWNLGARRAYGYAEEEARRLTMADLAPAPDRATITAMDEQALQTGSSGPHATRRLTRDGRLLDVSVTVSALRDEDGRARAVVSTEHDITEQLRLASDARFRAMADDIPTLLRIEDGDGRALYLNRAWLEFTGEPEQDVLLAQGWLRYIHPEDLPDYLQRAGEARGVSRRFDVDLRLRRADGQYRWMRTTGVMRCDEDGRPIGYVSVAVDIQERKLAEQALAEANARKDEFLAMLAHELRNPLAPIRNAAAVIDSVLPAEPKIAWATGVITRQSQHLARLVDDLMDVARIVSGKIALTREPIEMSVLAGRARDTAQPAMDARRQRLTVAVPAEPLYVEGDLVRLTQVVGNLLNNASKYSGEGGTIALEIRASEAGVEISVTDDGAGIAPDMLPRVFDLFVQEDKTLDRAEGGLGIGLTLVHRLVQLHGGSVEARSEGLGRGSQFLVRLPRLFLPEQARGDPAHGGPAWPADTRRVLVVDDNVDSAQSTAMLLEIAGHEVRLAYDGSAALALAGEFRPDVIVLDIGLPGMNGYELARHLRGRQETAGALLIALTGYGNPENAARIKAAGFDHHVVKPASPEQLSALIDGQART